jgi:hypothetical protein
MNLTSRRAERLRDPIDTDAMLDSLSHIIYRVEFSGENRRHVGVKETKSASSKL